MRMRAAKSTSGMQHRQSPGVNAGQQIERIERRCDSGGYLEMVNTFLCIALGIMHLAKNVITSADQKPSVPLGGDRPHGTRLLLRRQGVCRHTRVKRARRAPCVVDPPRNSFVSRIPSL